MVTWRKLTSAQQTALVVLVKAAEPPGAAGTRVEGGKQSSRSRPRPYVNMRAAHALVRLRLARVHMADFERGYVIPDPTAGFAHRDKYSVTAAGVAVYGER